MNKIVILPILMLLTGCMSKFSNKRFDLSEIRPFKKESKIERTEEMHFGPGPEEVEINIGPGPQDEVNLSPPETAPEQTEEKSSSWWG